MSLVQPGTCRHCRCDELHACRLDNGDPCCWTDRQQTVCSNPDCIVAEQRRIERAKELARATTPRRSTPAEVHEEIRRGRRRRRRAA